MASSEDLSDQLGLTTKLAAQVERMANAADKLEQSYTAQVESLQKIASVLTGMDTGGTVANINAINKALKDVQEQSKDTGKTSESTFQKLGKKVEDTGKVFVQKFPKSVAIGTAALSGFAQGVRNVVALGKGVTGFFTTFIGGVVDLAAAIIAIPFKIFSGLVDMAAKSAGGSNELAQAIENLRKEFGALGGPTNKVIIDMTTSLKGFSDTGLSAWRIFGNMAQRLEAFQKLAVEMGATFGTLRKEFADNGGALLAYQKGLGISDEAMKSVGARAISMGDTLGDTLKEMTKYSLDLAKAFGLDAKVLSRDVSKAMVDVKHFAGATIKEISEAATYARKLGLELDKITGTLDAFETFDSAAENVAKLSQAFGVQVDAFQLMEQQDPASQIDILRKAFSTAGVDASNFNRQQLKLLASTTGLDEATAKQAFSLKNQGAGLEQIKKKGGEAEKKTLTQAQAMEKLADAIERMVQSGGGLEGGFWDNFVKGIKNGIMASVDFRTTMLEIQRALRDVQMIGVQLGRVLVKIVPGFQDIFGGLKEFFAPQYFDKLFSGISDSVKKYFDKDSKDKGSIPALVAGLHKQFVDFLTAEGPNAKIILNGFKTFFKWMGKHAADGIVWLSDNLRTGVLEVIDVLTGKKKLGVAGGANGVKGGLGFLADILLPIGEALKHAWTVLKDPVRDLVMQVGGMLKKFLTSKQFYDFVKPVLPALAVALFGPAFSRAILGAITTTIAKSAIKSLMGGGTQAVIKKAGAVASEKVGKGLLGKAAGVAGPAALVVAALAVGKGVDEYTNTITSTLDHSSKVIAAGATGVIDALTLGLLPKDLKEQFANVMAKGVDMMFSAISAVFGTGFASSLKRYVAGPLEVLGGIWGVIKNLFVGDQMSFNKSVVELGAALLRFAVNSVEFLLVQMPTLIAKLTGQVLDVIAGIIVKLVGGALGLIAKGVDEVFGTSFTDKVTKWTDTIHNGLDKATDAFVKQQDDASKQISDATEKFNDTYLRTSADKAAQAASLAASAAKSVNDQVKDAASATGSGLSQVADNIAAVKAAKQQLDDKDFDIAGAVQDISNKLKNVSFDFISDTQIADMTKSVQSLHALDDFSAAATNSLSSFTAIAQATKTIKQGALAEAVKAVSEMVRVANEMDQALSDGNLNKIDIKAKLDNVAKAVGLGGKATYTVNPSKQVQITLNVEVTMDVDKVEKVMILRKQSIIRDRLDFATSNNVGGRVAAPLSSYSPQAPPPVPAAGVGSQ